MPKVPAPTRSRPPAADFEVDTKVHPLPAAPRPRRRDLAQGAPRLAQSRCQPDRTRGLRRGRNRLRQIMNNRNYPATTWVMPCSASRGCIASSPPTQGRRRHEKFFKLLSSDDPRVPDALLESAVPKRAMGAHRSAINRFYNVINPRSSCRRELRKLPVAGQDGPVSRSQGLIRDRQLRRGRQVLQPAAPPRPGAGGSGPRHFKSGCLCSTAAKPRREPPSWANSSTSGRRT